MGMAFFPLVLALVPHVTALLTAAPAAVKVSSASASAQAQPTGAASFPPVGSVPQDFSSKGLQQLWNIVGPVEPAPFSTVRAVQTPVVLPPAPPPLFPSFYANAPKDILPNLKFPKGFKFGVATAAYQVEGAVKADGKGPSVWDWAPRQPGVSADNTTGDITDLQYYLYKEDTARVAALGVNAHSFSVSWARIYPFGVKGSPLNQAGLNHYSDLIDFSWSMGIEPVLTLFHWDTPLALSAYYGAWTSPKIVDDFVNYATTVFKAYNGRIKTWYTFNEPSVICSQAASYPFNEFLAPGVNSSTARFHCSYNLLRAHAGAVKAFRNLNISGEIAFKNNGQVGQPWRGNNTEDLEAVERNAAFEIGAFSTPVYDTGDWPQIMKDTLSPAWLPRFTEQEKKDLKGSADFVAIDAYSSEWTRAAPSGIDQCKTNMTDQWWPACAFTMQSNSETGWAEGPASDPLTPWLTDSPQTLRYALKTIQQRWPSKKMYISEFGFAEPWEGHRTDVYRITDDVARTNYFMTYLGEALLAIHEDGIPLAGAFAWAMLDNAEWSSGLITRFGIQYVDYTTQERVYKRSAFALADFFKAHLQGNTTASLNDK